MRLIEVQENQVVQILLRYIMAIYLDYYSLQTAAYITWWKLISNMTVHRNYNLFNKTFHLRQYKYTIVYPIILHPCYSLSQCKTVNITWELIEAVLEFSYNHSCYNLHRSCVIGRASKLNISIHPSLEIKPQRTQSSVLLVDGIWRDCAIRLEVALCLLLQTTDFTAWYFASRNFEHDSEQALLLVSFHNHWSFFQWFKHINTINDACICIEAWYPEQLGKCIHKWQNFWSNTMTCGASSINNSYTVLPSTAGLCCSTQLWMIEFEQYFRRQSCQNSKLLLFMSNLISFILSGYFVFPGASCTAVCSIKQPSNQYEYNTCYICYCSPLLLCIWS